MSTTLIDSHAHLFFENYKLDFDAQDPQYKNYRNDLDEVLKRASDAGVEIIINIGVDVQRSKEALQQSKEISVIKVYSTIGIHPHDIENYLINAGALTTDLLELEQLYQENPTKIVAVGECGLDFFFRGDPGVKDRSISLEQLKKLQFQVFKAQLTLAKKLGLPLSIHCRDAWEELLPLIEGSSGVLHCYSGNLEITKRVLETPFYISFAGNLTYPKAENLREAAKLIPLDRIVIETDCPFLAPKSHRGERNEPAYVRETAECIAQVKGLTYEEVAKQTTLNAISCFKL